jgi:hypothetical protein
VILPSELTADVKRRAVQPLGLPEGDWGWSRSDGRVALDSLAGSIVAVFQVDVYAMPFGHREVIPTGRRASYLYHPAELALHFAERSRQMAGQFIDAGSSDELFVLYFTGQDDGEAAYGSSNARTG